VTDRVDILMSSCGNCVAEAVIATSRSGMMLAGCDVVAPASQASHVTLGTRTLKRGCIPVSVTLFKENKLQRWRFEQHVSLSVKKGVNVSIEKPKRANVRRPRKGCPE